jgi:polyhydroxyalkanoate synthesis repressor PhaR
VANSILLKKYANRRLYDTDQSAYVTLNEVAELIRQGKRVTVIDAKTKQDVTDFILTQIILEEARKKNALLPAPVLHLLIQYGDNLLGEFFDKYLQLTINSYLTYKAAFDEQFKTWIDLPRDMSELSPQAMAKLAPFRSFFDVFSESLEVKDKKDDK